MKKICSSILFLGIAGILLFSSCGNRTDDIPKDVTKKPDGFSDAGTIADDRDKFLGFYIGTCTCDLPGHWDAERFAFYVKDDPEDITKVRVEFPNQNHPYQIGWLATADGNTLIFDDSLEDQKNDCEAGSAKEYTLNLKGTATFDGKTFLFPDFTYTIQDSAGEVSCVIACNIIAEKIK